MASVVVHCGRQRSGGGAVCLSPGDHVAGTGDCGRGGSDLCGDALAEQDERGLNLGIYMVVPILNPYKMRSSLFGTALEFEKIKKFSEGIERI